MTDKKKKPTSKKQKGTVNQMGKQNQSVIVKVNVGNSGGGKKKRKTSGAQAKKQPDTAQILAQALARSKAMSEQAERVREFNRPAPAFTTIPSVRSNPLPARPRSPPPMGERYNRQPPPPSSPIIEEIFDEPGGILLEDGNQGGGLLEDGPADQGGLLLENGAEEEEEETPPVMYENPMHQHKEKAPTPLAERLRLKQPPIVKNPPRGGPLNRDWSPISMSERLQQSRQPPAPVSGEKATTDEPDSPIRDMMPGDISPPLARENAPVKMIPLAPSGQSSSRPAIERGRPVSQEKLNLRIRMMKDIDALPDDKVIEHVRQRGIQAELGPQELQTIYERVKGEPYPYQNTTRNTILSALGVLHAPKPRKKKDDDEEPGT